MTKGDRRAYQETCVFLHHEINSVKAVHYRRRCCRLSSPTSLFSCSMTTGANMHSNMKYRWLLLCVVMNPYLKD